VNDVVRRTIPDYPFNTRPMYINSPDTISDETIITGINLAHQFRKVPYLDQ